MAIFDWLSNLYNKNNNKSDNKQNTTSGTNISTTTGVPADTLTPEEYTKDIYSKLPEQQDKLFSAVDNAYKPAIDYIEKSVEQIPSTYDSYRAAANAQYARNYRNNAEAMANLGLSRSGLNMTNLVEMGNERERNLSEVDSAQATAVREAEAQINQYNLASAQEKTQILKDLTANAESAIQSYTAQYNQLQQKYGYDEALQKEAQDHESKMQKLAFIQNLALTIGDAALSAAANMALQGLQIAGNVGLSILENRLNNSSYAYKAGVDWDYTKKKSALDYEYDVKAYNLKNSTSKQSQKSTSTSKSGSSAASSSKSAKISTTNMTPNSLSAAAKKIFNFFDEGIMNLNKNSKSSGKAVTDTGELKSFHWRALYELTQAHDNGSISDKDMAYLIKRWGL